MQGDRNLFIMKGICREVQQRNRKKSFIFFNALLLLVAMLFVCNKSIIVDEVRNLLKLFNLESMETLLATFVLPSNTIIELSQVVSVMCLLEVALIVTIIAIILILFISVVDKKIIKDKGFAHIISSDVVLCKRDTYKETLRFLC